ncbi:polysaccharide pyruvyl transferase family protein [Aquiflexum sp. TKW24L]|uniref:polysaccharide pyruvyl transferase family protein n=1 Tax=Aquiflexum sp. TKW24L TaxID=2942212 RepID=UPI0020BE9DA4|nr:polysaccharide pyruvyl transferase family protein [Aquiflexum sp. TKW24L]MCL6260676.1 polysaccharide pyruvyl transferase family protein [Aquiflexum sp. TKW24L]
MEKILVIGAFDRYNYGDLLFPLIIEKQLNTYNIDFEFHFFGLVESDLSKEGGFPTEDLQAFYKACQNPTDKVHVIVAGGEALGVTWHSLLAALNKTYQKIHRYHIRISKIVDLNGIARKVLGGKTILPFVFTKSDFPGVKSVILNSLGGSGLKKAQFEQYDFLKKKLIRADYLAVRDKTTVSNLKENGVNAQLFPDSAILMSEFYPVTILETQITNEVRSYVKENKGSYVFFQINKKTTVGKEDLIAAELDKIQERENVKICLCPIGKALNHDDHLALEAVKGKMISPATYFDADNIWDIMYLIANSKCYIGTSLHGAITALSYAVPHVGLKVEKLDAYLNTWGAKGNNFAVDFSEIYTQFLAATVISKSVYEEKRDIQISEMKKAFDQMVKILQ